LKDSVVEHYSSPAVRSTKRKLDPDLPTRHWWIIEPAAHAIDIASQLSFAADARAARRQPRRAELAFSAVSPRHPTEGFDGADAINFIAHVNHNRQTTGLDEIPRGKVNPHQFRRPMAMLTRDFPGSEIAVGMQLKHAASRALAHRTTLGYMDQAPSWACHLDQAIADRRFERLRELFDADTRGETLRSRRRPHARFLRCRPPAGRVPSRHRPDPAR
jgi:hypothetical protein